MKMHKNGFSTAKICLTTENGLTTVNGFTTENGLTTEMVLL